MKNLVILGSSRFSKSTILESNYKKFKGEMKL